MVKSVSLILDKKQLLTNVKYCDTIFSKLKGLMFSKPLKKNEGLIMELDRESKELASIHMLFVFFPIDVYWLDNNFKVVDIRKRVKPFSIMVRPKKKAKYIVETNCEAIKLEMMDKKLKIRN